jgi:PAS domain S-box-containing protein
MESSRLVLAETARALAESATLGEATPKMLRVVCEALGWERGSLWRVDRAAAVLRCMGTWPGTGDQFDVETRRITFSAGVGLPGRVWKSGKPAWIPDVVKDANFPRAPIASAVRLHAAFGFPVVHAGALLGVMEFFSGEIRPPDEELLGTLSTIGTQIGQFVDRKRVEEELDRHFRLSLDMQCVATFDGYFTRVNPAWRALGYSDEELCSAPFMSFVHPDDREATQHAMARLREGADLTSFANRYRSRDGSYRWLEWACAPLSVEGLIYAAARDVTERKEAEAQLTRYAQQMADAKRKQEQNAARLSELVRELEVAKHRAEAATATKAEFLANVSHEIRTPMNAVIGMTELALRTPLTAVQRDYLNTVLTSAEALLALIDDILDFSKIEARRLELDRVPFIVRDTVEDAVRLLAPRAHEKRLELACRIHPDVPVQLVGDPGRLRQVLVNLVGNAIKFTEQGEVVVDVAPDQSTDQEAALRVRVTDTGIGIPPEKQWTIFGPFVQADASTTRRYGGTGLGLAISAQLVELMGGRIWLDSEVGRGSTFNFVARFARPGAEGIPPGPDPGDLQGLRVLIVDDNATNRQILEETIKSWQMRPVAVDAAEAAIARLRAARAEGDPVRLVLADALMPDVDGFDLARRVAQDADLAGTPLILLTSAGSLAAGHAPSSAIAAHLTKPVKQSDLLEAIQEVVAPGRLAEPHPPVLPERGAGLPPLRILVAEDNATNRKLLVTLLEQGRHHVVTVENGLDAVARSATGRFDVILMDVQMPELGGLEATQAIRAREHGTRAHVPIIALTAHAMAGDRERCLAAGMDGYLSKPIRPVELLETIGTVIGARVKVDAADELVHELDAMDEKTLIESFNGNRMLLREVIDTFVEDCPRMMEEVNAATRAGDPARLQAAAHKLKGAVGLFTAADVFELARKLEGAGRAGDLAGVGELSAAVETGIVRLTSRLEDLRLRL